MAKRRARSIKERVKKLPRAMRKEMKQWHAYEGTRGRHRKLGRRGRPGVR